MITGLQHLSEQAKQTVLFTEEVKLAASWFFGLGEEEQHMLWLGYCKRTPKKETQPFHLWVNSYAHAREEWARAGKPSI
jgi:hypothetical protein